MLPMRSKKEISDPDSALNLSERTAEISSVVVKQKNSDSTEDSDSICQLKKSTSNFNANNNSKRRNESPVSLVVSNKSLRLAADVKEVAGKDRSDVIDLKSDKARLDLLALASLQTQNQVGHLWNMFNCRLGSRNKDSAR